MGSKKKESRFGLRVIPVAVPDDLDRDLPQLHLCIAETPGCKLVSAAVHPRGGYSLLIVCPPAKRMQIIDQLVKHEFRPAL
jgi:hypothetical protein